jgi:hypothetical protein
LFNIFIHLYISENNPQAPETGTTAIAELIFAGDLACSSFTINGLQKATDHVTKFCREWDLKYIGCEHSTIKAYSDTITD